VRNGRWVGIGLSLLWVAAAQAQEVHGGIGYAHIFRAGGFSFTSGYLQPLNASASAVRHRVGGDFWYANTDVASQPPGNAARDIVGVGVRYDMELARCCGRLLPMLAIPVQALHSSIASAEPIAGGGVAPAVVPTPESPLPPEDQGGSAWGWSAGVEVGLRVRLGPDWNLQTTGTAMYQDVYAGSSTNGAWALHAGLGYRFGGS
jgi:hypothetical protein